MTGKTNGPVALEQCSKTAEEDAMEGDGGVPGFFRSFFPAKTRTSFPSHYFILLLHSSVLHTTMRHMKLQYTFRVCRLY